MLAADDGIGCALPGGMHVSALGRLVVVPTTACDGSGVVRGADRLILIGTPHKL